MAQCKQTAYEFIQECFSPMVAVLSSPDADAVCKKNNLSFVELVQPFCRLTSEAYIRDPLTNANYCIKNMHLIIKEMNHFPPQPTLAKKMLNEAVYSSHPSTLDGPNARVVINDCHIQYPSSTPWYEAFRSQFLQIAYPSDHEFTKTYLSCIFVVSSNHPDPLDQINRLNQRQHQQQHQSPTKLPKWFTPNIFKYYVLLHDLSCGDMAKAETIFQGMKYQYGAHACHLLQMNSANAEMSSSTSDENSGKGGDGSAKPDPWSQFLSKRPNKYDSYEIGPQTPREDSNYEIFPGHVNEGKDQIDDACNPEEGIEVKERGANDHPLAIDNHVNKTNSLTKKSTSESILEKDSPLGTDYIDDWSTNANETNDNNAKNEPTATANNEHGNCLTASDIDRIRIFVHEFCMRGFFPYAEKLMRTLNDQVSNRKGLHKSLISATRKWFGGNKSGIQNATVPSNSVVYSQEALELQIRRLGDLAFMFQNYDLAYQAYHSAKRDFNNDQAWFYYAGALEMAGLSVFMHESSSAKQYPHHYLDNAITTYTSCNAPEFATRAAMLSTECLKNRKQLSEAAMQYIRMTSEDSDLTSALLLEQAAYCFLATVKPPPMARKYAFHMILAGHRFSKAAQRKHSLRCYKQAYQIYGEKGWSLAEDHINFTIGRQSLNVKEIEKACDAFQVLLQDASQQSAAQQAAFLKEFAFVYNELCDEKGGTSKDMEKLKHLSIPKLHSGHVKVLVSVDDASFDDDTSVNVVWNKLESIGAKQSSNIIVTHHALPLYTKDTPNSHQPQAVVNEQMMVELKVENTFKIPLVLSNVHLLWKFEHKDEHGNASSDTNHAANGHQSTIVQTQHIDQLHFEGLQTLKMHLGIKAHKTGELAIIGISYDVAMTNQSAENGNANAKPVSINGVQMFSVRGPRLNKTKTEKCSVVYGPDRRLEIKVKPPMPFLQVKFYGSPTSMLSGEIKQMMVEFTNVGSDSIDKLYVASDLPHLFSFGSANMHVDMDYGVYKASPLPTPRKLNKKRERQSSVQPVYIDSNASIISRVCQIPLESRQIQPNESIRVPLWLWAPKSSCQLKMLFMYYSPQHKSQYRTLRHVFNITVSNSIQVEAVASRLPTVLSSHHQYNSIIDHHSNGLHVSLQVANLNKPTDSNITEITLVQLSSVSQHWSLVPFSLNHRHGVNIGPGQKCNTSLKCVPFKIQDSGDKGESVLAFSNIALTDSEIDSSSSPCSDFYHRSKLQLDDLMAEQPLPACLLPDEAPPSANSILSDQLNAAIRLDITLIILWKAFVVDEEGMNHVIMGQQHVDIDQLNSIVQSDHQQQVTESIEVLKLNPDYESPDDDHISFIQFDHLVSYGLKHDHQIQHDFINNGPYVLPVTVTLVNCCQVSLLVEICTSSSKAAPSSLTTFDDASRNFGWIGCKNTQLILEPCQSKNIEMNACFIIPGTYNLSTILVKVKPQSNLVPINVDNQDGFIWQKPIHSSVAFVHQTCN